MSGVYRLYIYSIVKTFIQSNFFYCKIRELWYKDSTIETDFLCELYKCTQNKYQLGRSVLKNAVMAMDKNFKIKIKYQCTVISLLWNCKQK